MATTTENKNRHRSHRLERPSGYQYSRDSIERALTIHFGEGGEQGWTSNAKGGYLISTGRGILEVRTLREAALIVIASAEKARRIS